MQLPWDLLLLPMCTAHTDTLITTHIVQLAADSTHNVQLAADSTHTQTQQSATHNVPSTADSTHT